MQVTHFHQPQTALFVIFYEIIVRVQGEGVFSWGNTFYLRSASKIVLIIMSLIALISS